MGVQQMMLSSAARLRVVSITNQGAVDSNPGGTVTVRYQLRTDGSVWVDDFGFASVETWLLIGANSDFEVRATAVSGTLTSGTIGSWELLSSQRTWALTAGNTDDFAEITIEIRDALTQVVLDSCTVNFAAYGAPL